MPPTRRTTGGARARPGPVRGQSTISFSGRVTKSVAKSSKDAVASPGVAKVPKPEEPASPAEHVDSIDVDEPDSTDEAEPEPSDEAVPEKTETETRAEALSDARINQYWRAVERQRKAPRVHQEGLAVSEKVLRYFDVSSQYGPCIGLDRLKRWQRAERLGLNPPIEVLAVLLKAETRGSREMETAHMDKILGSTAVSA